MRVNGFRRFLLFVVGTAAVLYLPSNWSGRRARAEWVDDTLDRLRPNYAAFVSLHCNAPSTTQRSTIVYYRSDIVSSQAMSAPLVSNFPAVWYLFRTFTTAEAAPLPRQTMLRELADRNNRLHTWKMPCNLMEMVMLTNEEDEDLIALTEGQAAFAEDVHKSYCGFTFSEMLYFD